MLDIAKAFENILHRRLVEAARAFGFHLGLLRWLLGLYRMPRRLSLHGVLSEAVFATLSVVAGSSFADLMMRLMTEGPVRRARLAWPSVLFVVVVDDVQGLVHGSEAFVRTSTPIVAEAVADDLRGLGLPISEPKILMTASSPHLSKAIVGASRLLKKARRREVRNLGADFAAGQPLLRRHRAACVMKVLWKARRFSRLRVAGRRGLRIARGAIGPGSLFAVAITGISPGHLRLIRSAYHRMVVKNPSGRSAVADIALLDPKADPAYVALGTPLAWISYAKNRGLLSRHMIAASARWAFQQLDRDRPMKLVRGPVGAAVASAFTIGWISGDGLVWTTPEGLKVDILADDPYSVKVAAHRSISAWLWRQSGSRHVGLAHLSGPPRTAPYVALLGQTSSLSHRRKGLLRAFLSGAFRFDLTCSCGESFSTSAEVWSHFAWDCPITEVLRREFGHRPLVLRHAKSYMKSPFMSSGWLPDPSARLPSFADPPLLTWAFHEDEQEQDPLFRGPCFGDGSTFQNKCKIAARAGWAVVEVTWTSSNVLRWRRRLSGTFPGYVQENNGAELYALLMWLRHIDPTAYLFHTPVFYSDSRWVVDGWGGGFDPANLWTPHWGLWQQVLVLRKDLPNLRVVWTPAHSSARAAAARRDGLWERTCNEMADVAAKAAARSHPRDPLVELAILRADSLLETLGLWYSAVLDFALKFQVLPSRPPSSARGYRIPRLPKHTLALDVQGMPRCVRCLVPADLCPVRPCRMPVGLPHLYRCMGGVSSAPDAATTPSFAVMAYPELAAGRCRPPPPLLGGLVGSFVVAIPGLGTSSASRWICGLPLKLSTFASTISTLTTFGSLPEAAPGQASPLGCRLGLRVVQSVLLPLLLG